MIAQVMDYITTLPDGQKMTVPEVEVEICDHCGERALSLASMRKVEEYVEEGMELLSSEELERIREAFGVDQARMGEVLGLGGKTYHRWEKGHQVPSRSMCYYLRALERFPNVFSWLNERGWEKPNNIIHVDFRSQFPHLRESVGPSRYKVASNPARALVGRI